MPTVTVFSAPKAFEGHIGVIQRNAIRSWQQLGDRVEVLLLGDEAGLEQAATECGVRWLEGGERNAHGTPLLNALFARASRAARHELMCYINADVLLLEDFLDAVERTASIGDRFLLAGQRWDLKVAEAIDFSEGWQARMRLRLGLDGRRHRKTGSDYFVYPKQCFSDLPPFALGRAGWDNWMIYEARRLGIPVIDGSTAITAIHQDHDYAHLPNSRPHYHLPESDENVRLAGGRRHIFTLLDADWVLLDGNRERPRRRSWSLRALEAGLLLSSRSQAAKEAVFAVFHPLRALRQWSGRLRSRFRGAE